MQKFIKYFVLFSVLFCFAHCAIQGFENGKYYKVTSIATGKFLTVDGQQFKSGAHVIVKEWNGQNNQKWLALEAPLINSFERSVSLPGQKFYLIPLRQQFDWANISHNGSVNVNITFDNLPAGTEVFTLHAETGNIATEVWSRGSSSQQWIPEDAGDGRIFLRNLGNNQCLKNFDYRPASLFHKIASFLSRFNRQPSKPQKAPKPLGTFDCSTNEVAEKWIVEFA